MELSEEMQDDLTRRCNEIRRNIYNSDNSSLHTDYECMIEYVRVNYNTLDNPEQLLKLIDFNDMSNAIIAFEIIYSHFINHYKSKQDE